VQFAVERYNRSMTTSVHCRLLVFGAILALPVCFAASKRASNRAEDRLNESAAVLKEVMDAPDKGVPQELLDKAKCIVIVPGVKKGAFIIGGKYGRGFVSCRGANNVGWSAPGAVKMEGGSFGFQIGGSETDVVMIVLNDRGADKLLSSKFTVGADAAAAAGPVGRASSAETDATMRAEILTYSRSRGVFAGISLQGATLRPDTDAISQIYTRPLDNKDIIKGATPVPASAQPLIAMLNKYSGRK
jgi:lipid-binding SYLF domain-containing protein